MQPHESWRCVARARKRLSRELELHSPLSTTSCYRPLCSSQNPTFAYMCSRRPCGGCSSKGLQAFTDGLCHITGLTEKSRGVLMPKRAPTLVCASVWSQRSFFVASLDTWCRTLAANRFNDRGKSVQAVVYKAQQLLPTDGKL